MNEEKNIQELFDFIQDKAKGAIPLAIFIRGSHAYGTNTETSDTDFVGVYVQNEEDIYGFNYKEQINDDKNDMVFYEIKRFLELLSKQNPNTLELLNTPEDCIVYKHPIYQTILDNKDMFITKGCAKTFGGYAQSQIKKAKGTDKKQNWEMDRVVRKEPIDFAYIFRGTNSRPLRNFLDDNGLDQKFCGLSKMNHSRDSYALYYDFESHSMYNEKMPLYIREINKFVYRLVNFLSFEGFKIIKGKNVLGFNGIGFEDSNTIRTSSIPKNLSGGYFLGYISYNEDSYSNHCNDYYSYEKWLKERNEARFVDVQNNGQKDNRDMKIDGKNLLHCVRLLRMAKEISEGKGIVIRRPDAKYLLDIRKGQFDLNQIIEESETIIKTINENFKTSTLPEAVDLDKVNDILINIRKEIYDK
jgi:hypothetical protein